MERVVPENGISCAELVEFMEARPELYKNFIDVDDLLFDKHHQTVKSIKKRLGYKINRLEEDLII
jgi:predicted AAA+ superfamily ATPase